MPGFSLRAPEGTAPKDFKKAQNAVADEDDDHHGHQEPQGWGRGIISDFKTTIGTHWVKEVTNFNTKTIGVSLFLFIAVIAPSITFGAGGYCASTTMTAYRCFLPHIFFIVSSLRKEDKQLYWSCGASPSHGVVRYLLQHGLWTTNGT